jgi:hypothetical protein
MSLSIINLGSFWELCCTITSYEVLLLAHLIQKFTRGDVIALHILKGMQKLLFFI